MVGISRASTLAIVAQFGFASLCVGQVWLATLEQASSRTRPDAMPTYEGQEIAVAGQVSAKAVWNGDLYLLPIQDAGFHGLSMRGSLAQFAGFSPGDWVQARGTISQYAGMIVFLPREIQQISSGQPPKPKQVKVAALNSSRFLGTLVGLQGRVLGRYEKAGRDTLLLRQDGQTIDIVLGPTGGGNATYQTVTAGTYLSVTGIASQYCPDPPFNRSFQVLVPEGAQIGPMAVLLQPSVQRPLALGLLGVLILCGWLLRERYLARRRAALRSFHALSEEVLVPPSAAEIVAKVNSALPKIASDLTASLYIYNRGLEVLELVTSGQDTLASSIRPDGPVGALASGVSLCFRNRTLLNVPDTQRSPFFNEDDKKHLPRSIVFVPMFAQLELVGVMQVTSSRNLHSFSLEDQAALQHLANQAGAAVQIQERREVRERLFQTEKLAAAGQLLAGIAGELRSPVGSILELTGALITRRRGERELELIEAEALRASEIVSRLVAFGRTERTEAQAVDVHTLLTRLLRLPALARLPGGIPKPQFPHFRVTVMGSQSQLEQVFLNLIVYAGQASSGEAPISMSSSLLAGRVLIEIGYRSSQTSEMRAADPFENGGGKGALLGLGLCRGLIQSHGGDVRFVRASLTDCRFEVELPVSENQQFRLGSTSSEVPVSRRQLTALMVEPDLRSQKQIVEILTKRGDRVVPIGSGEEAADLVLRMSFDVVLCSARLPGLNWVEFFERVRRNIGSFILLTHGHDQDLSKTFQNGEGFVLTKPLDERVLNRICDAIAERTKGSLP